MANVPTTYVTDTIGELASCKVSTEIAEKVVKPPSTPVTTKCLRFSLVTIFCELATRPISNAPTTFTAKVAQGKAVSLEV